MRRETALHGREADLALLGQVWDRAAQGEGTTVLVEGEAGIGKSRLVDAFLADVDGRDATILYGSYAPTGGRGGISDALLAHFGKADLEEALRPYLGVTPSLVPALAAFLKHDSPPEGSPSLQGDTLHTVLVHLMRGLGEERPLVWVIEDLHFADADSRKLILSLARAVEGHRVLLLLTTRPELPEEELAHLGRLENLVRTWLGRLGAREVISLLQDAFRSQVLAEKLGGKIAFKSDGVPFFVFEMIRGLREGQFITQLPDGSWIESKVIEEIEVPATVRDLIGIRLSGLSREERAILDVGAVQGFEFDPDLVARVLERPRLAVLQDAAEIERRSGILRATAENLRFDQHQIQEVLSNDLLPGLRKEYHWLLFRAMATREGASPEEVDALPGETAIFLASHGLQGREPDAGLPYLDRTLDHLAAGLRSEQAVELAVRALGAEGLLQGAARARVLIRLGGADGPLRLLGRFDQIASVSEEAVAVSQEIGEASGEASALANLGHAHNALGQFTEAEGHLEHSVTLFRRIGDRVGESRAAGHLGNLLVNMGLHQRARECHEQCLSLAQECEDRTLVVRALAGLGRTLRVLCDYPAASEKHEQSLAIAREIGDKRGEAIALGELGLTRLRVLDVVGAQECFERDLALLRETGDRAGEMVPTGNLGNVFSLLGDHDAAQHSHERALGIAREIGDRNAEATLAANLGIDYQDQGCLRQAREWFQQDLAISCDIGARGGEMRANANLGHFFLKVGRYEEAKAHTERALTTAREIGRRDTEGTALTNLGAIAESRGDGDASHSRFVEALDLFREIDVRGDAAYLLMRLGRLCGAEGRTRESRRYLEEAISLGRDTGNLLPVFLASCHLAELSGSAPTEAISTFDWCEAGFTPSMEVEARFYLWRATNDPSPLTEAKRLLDHLVEHAPEEYRESMLKNVRVNREIMEAWAEHGEKAVGDGEEPS